MKDQTKDLFVRMKEAEEAGREAGKQYDANFRRLYMTERLASGLWTTPAKEPKNLFSRAAQPDEHEWWRIGYQETAYNWLSE